MNFFSSNIRKLRKQNGLRQAEIHEWLGFTRTTWSNYENGISQPSLEGLISIARFFSISVSDLLEKEIESTPSNTKSRRTTYPYNRAMLKRPASLPASDQECSTAGAFWERTSTW